MQFAVIIFAIDIAYKWFIVCRTGSLLGVVALLLLHALLLRCCKLSSPTLLQSALYTLFVPGIILCQAIPTLNVPGLPKHDFPPYKSRNGGIFQVFIVGQIIFWYCNYFYGNNQHTLDSPYLQMDAILSLLDGASHFCALVETFNNRVNIVVLSCLVHDTCYSMFLNHSRHLITWPSPLGILLVFSIGLRMMALIGAGTVMVMEERSLSAMFTVLPAFALLIAFVWPVAHTLGLYSLLLCTINFSAAARFDPKMLNVYRCLLRWIHRGRNSSKMQYLRKRLGTVRPLKGEQDGPPLLSTATWTTLTATQRNWALGIIFSLSLWAAAVFSGWLYISMIVYYYWKAFSALLWVSGSLILLTAICTVLGPSFSPLFSYAELSLSAPFADFNKPAIHPLFACTQGHPLCEALQKSPALTVVQDYYYPTNVYSAFEYCVGKNFLVGDVRVYISSYLVASDLQLCIMQQMMIQAFNPSPSSPLLGSGHPSDQEEHSWSQGAKKLSW